MQNILIIGAGRSSSFLIKYLLNNAPTFNWKITVADISLANAKNKIGNSTHAEAVEFNINDATQREKLISNAQIVISMLPAFMHMDVAHDCLRLGKHLATASYVSKEMEALHEEATKKNLLFLNEIGLDPGIDHMSAMKLIDELKEKGANITSFKSYCGGLVAPESNDNPWGYKFSWNPRNVILAGQSTAQFFENNQLKFIPYNRLYTQTNSVEVDGLGKFDAYANRDSLSYRQPYGLENIPTILRGTLREHNYCKAWNVFVKLGLTDDTFVIENTNNLTYNDLINSFLQNGNQPTKDKLKQFMKDEWDADIESKLEWLGLFNNEKIKLDKGTPAQLLQDLLEKKWLLKKEDKDMIVMQHQFEYELAGKKQQIFSSLIVKGEDDVYTAMAKTVGLPLAIAVKLILTDKIKVRGVQIPVIKAIYEPILQELETFDVIFHEKIIN
ncbi:MAG: saccharopine dehydrogenase C-terminal domain-containing protein [Bacteroidota bacterium]